MMPSGRWSIVPEKGSDKVVGMFGHTAHIFKDQLHVFGGVDKDGNFSNTHAVLDLSTHQWTKYTPTSNCSDGPSSRNFHASCLHENSMFLFGGKSNGYHSDLYKLNLKTRKWKIINQTGKAPLARYGHGASVYQGCIYVFGGYDQHGMDDDSLYEFNIATSVWRKVKVQRQPQGVNLGRFHHCQVVYKDSLLIFGGKGANYSDSEVTNDILQYAFHTQTWQILSDSKAREGGYEPCARWGSSMALIGDDLFIFGGRDSVSHFQDFYKFNIPSCRWTKMPMEKGHPLARYFHYSVAYKNGFLLLWGKNLFDFEFTEIIQWESFDPDTPSVSVVTTSTTITVRDSPRGSKGARTSDGKKKKDGKRSSRVISSPITSPNSVAATTAAMAMPSAHEITKDHDQHPEIEPTNAQDPPSPRELKKHRLVERRDYSEYYGSDDGFSGDRSSDSDSNSMKEWEEKLNKNSELVESDSSSENSLNFGRGNKGSDLRRGYEYSGDSGSESSYLRDYSSAGDSTEEDIFIYRADSFSDASSESGSEEYHRRGKKRSRPQPQQRPQRQQQHQIQIQHQQQQQQRHQRHNQQKGPPSPSQKSSHKPSPSPSPSPSPLSRSSSIPQIPDGVVTFKWRRGNLLGAGAFAQVYLCMQMDTGRLMAVKKVNLPSASPTFAPSSPRPSSTNNSNSATLKAMKAVAQLEREIAVLNTLSHPNIVEYIGYKRTSKALNIFLEYQAEFSFQAIFDFNRWFYRELIEHVWPFSRMHDMLFYKTANTDQCLKIVSGLTYLHSNNIAHRDVKGANVLAGTDGTVKLADFGTSAKLRKIASLSTGFTTVTGTPYWMAPEVIRQGCEGRNERREKERGDSYGCKADVWSLGATIIEMATCKPPWSDLPPVSALFKIGSSLSTPPLPPDFLPAGQDFLRKCFQRNVSKRASSAELQESDWFLSLQKKTHSPTSDKRPAEHEPQTQQTSQQRSQSPQQKIRTSLYQSQETPKVKQERRKIKSEEISSAFIRTGLTSSPSREANTNGNAMPNTKSNVNHSHDNIHYNDLTSNNEAHTQTEVETNTNPNTNTNNNTNSGSTTNLNSVSTPNLNANKSKKLDKTLRSSLRRPHSQKFSSLSFGSLGWSGSSGGEEKEKEKEKEREKKRDKGRKEGEGEGEAGLEKDKEGEKERERAGGGRERGGSKGSSGTRGWGRKRERERGEAAISEVKRSSGEKKPSSEGRRGKSKATETKVTEARGGEGKNEQRIESEDMQFSVLAYLRNEM